MTGRNVACTPAAGRDSDVLGMRHVWKLEPEQSGGAFMAVEVEVPPGQGVPAHRHTHEDETFYVLSGRVTFEGDDCADPVTLGPGGLFHGPRGRVHAFRCDGAQAARILVMVRPAAGMDAMWQELACDPGGPELVAAIARRYGVEVP